MRRRMLIIAAVLALAGCATGSADPVSGTIAVSARDYSFENVPEVMAAGAEITLSNESDAEMHEIVLVKIADVESRTIEELLELPDDESESLVEFQGVLVAMPGEEGSNPEAGGSSITVTEPGRYAMVCFIPQGADPALFAEGAEGEEGPDLGDGTPHAFLGMVEEFSVEEA